MKKLLFFLFSGSIVSAQSPELFSNSWYISKMVINGQTTATPPMQVNIGTSVFNNSGTAYDFQSRYYNSAGSIITFSPTSNSFTRQGGGCTLAIYNGTNAVAAQAYDQQNCDFYFNSGTGAVFNYQIVTSGTLKTLIITRSSTGDQIFYNNSGFLGTRENILKKPLSIYPNPVKDMLNLEGVPKNSAVKIYDLSGRKVLEAYSEDTKLKIDISRLSKGTYMIRSENIPAQKFIKE
ncbi:T9SS type A sorting domain-containing protein [uncultured Chryseobacterium sp.]|uniref:T9SS type A sorting domain-containing protein n=2 Tax=uncultured Chryseobacterium sp. TaxID=259322 RepID=UPI0025FDFC47|nr:T9SS type A sorting domain-containing protein [uncultured Chryseobacterium sp.]